MTKTNHEQAKLEETSFTGQHRNDRIGHRLWRYEAVTADQIVMFPSVMGHAREIRFHHEDIATEFLIGR
jgi:hypothetical protein